MSTREPKTWNWLKRYRVWEANRRVFLFPENWIEPEKKVEEFDGLVLLATNRRQDWDKALLRGQRPSGKPGVEVRRL